MKDALPPSLAQADRVYVYTAGLGWDARSLFALLGARARCEEDLGALVEAIVAEARAGDHVLIMSNGGFGGIHEKLLARLSARFNSSPHSHKAQVMQRLWPSAAWRMSVPGASAACATRSALSSRCWRASHV